MKKKSKVECPVCGALAVDVHDLCSAARSVQGCVDAADGAQHATEQGREERRPGLAGPGRFSSRRGTASVELILCEQVGKHARYTCGACGRQATAEGLLCLPREHGER